MSKSVKRKGVWGEEYIEHYDDKGNKIGESHEREAFWGGKYIEHTDAKGNKIGESHEQEAFWGGKYNEHTDAKGNKTGESHEREGFWGGKYTEHTDAKGNKIGESEAQEGVWGEEYTEHSGTSGWRGAKFKSSTPPSTQSTSSSSSSSSSYKSSGSAGSIAFGSSGIGESLGVIIVLGVIGIICYAVIATLGSGTEAGVAALIKGVLFLIIIGIVLALLFFAWPLYAVAGIIYLLDIPSNDLKIITMILIPALIVELIWVSFLQIEFLQGITGLILVTAVIAFFIMSDKEKTSQRQPSSTRQKSASSDIVISPFSAIGKTQTSLNIRKGPGTQYGKITAAKKEEELSIIGKSGTWYRVRLQNGSVGYVSAKYITLRKESSQTEANSVFAIKMTPLTPGTLKFRQKVNIAFKYSTIETAGVSIFLDPVLPPICDGSDCYFTGGSLHYPSGNGTGSYSFSVYSKNTYTSISIKNLHVTMHSSKDFDKILYETFIPVNYHFTKD